MSPSDAILTTSAAAESASPTSSAVDIQLFDGFRTPQPEFSPLPIWWWDGERVESSRLRWQLDRLVEQGIHNVMPVNLAPIGPLFGARADEPHLFSEDWWQLWSTLCEDARERGMRLWFYDQIGFSGANIQGQLVTASPAFAGARLDRLAEDTDSPCELTCPAAATPVAACALPIDDAGAVTGPPVPLEIIDGRARWPGGAGRRRVMLAYSLRVGFDYTSPQACAALIDAVHGEFERRLGRYLGSVIAGSFQDELPSIPTWSPSFAAEFQRRRGYPVEPALAGLWEDWGMESSRVRADYQQVRAELAEEAFFEPLFSWHEERGMITGFDQQSPSRGGEPLASVEQYADYQRTHRWYGAPGSDHWGDAKIHSSLAHCYGRPRTWIEAFHNTGWGGTLEETFDWLMPWLLAGATLYNPHAVYYSAKGGWWEWAAPSTCWRQPYWRHYRQFADTVSRLCWLLSQGEHVCDVAVLFPATTVQASTLLSGALPDAVAAHDTYLATVGQMMWFYSRAGAIAEAGHDFDVLDEESVAAAAVSDSTLRVRAEQYRAVVVPGCRTMTSATASRLADFCADGGLLVFVGQLPEHTADDPADKAVVRLRELVEQGLARHVGAAGELPAALAAVRRRTVAGGPVLHRRVGETNVLLVPAAPTGSATEQPMLPWIGELRQVDGAILTRYQSDLRQHGYRFDAAHYRSRTLVRVNGEVGAVEQWDPLTGKVSRPPVNRTEDGLEVEVDFASAPAAVLVWRSGAAATRSEDDAAAASWQQLSLDGSWTSRLVPTAHGEAAGQRTVTQWRVRHRLETGPDDADRLTPDKPGSDAEDWSDAHVGFGTWAWRLGPVDEGGAPAPRRADDDGPLNGPGWAPVRYSLSRGIDDDPLHAWSQGPKGRVPEEFWHVDEVDAGQVVVFRTTLAAASGQPIFLATAANGVKDVWWNGERLPDDPGGHLRLDEVVPRPGANLLELRVTAESSGALRGYWTLTTNPAAFVRPSWIAPGGAAGSGSTVIARRVLSLSAPPRSATLQLGTRGPATLAVNGQEVAVQGAFDPYGGDVRVLPHDITDTLRAGENVIEIALRETSGAVGAFVDADMRVADTDGVTLVSDDSWSFTRDGEAVSTVVERSHEYDPSWALLYPRPHPLPRTAWLNGVTKNGGDVLDVAPDALAGRPRPAEWFRLTVPPGAARVRLPLASSQVRAWLDGSSVVVEDGVARLAEPAKERRVLTVRVEPEDGRTEGALWDAAPSFDVGVGRISPGDWAAVGLGSYSGGVEHSRTVMLERAPATAVLDLGSVRGTAEVIVNGIDIGARIWSPYRFDITHALRAGQNQLQVKVFNTLAPYLADASPTPMVFAGQRASGLFGPVWLLTTDSP